MPIKQICPSCKHRLISLSQAKNATVYPCLQYGCKITEKPREEKKNEFNPVIAVTKYYFDTNAFTEGDVVCIEELKSDGYIFPAILFSVEQDKILAMRDTGKKTSVQLIIRPEDVAGGIYKITKLDWASLL